MKILPQATLLLLGGLAAIAHSGCGSGQPPAVDGGPGGPDHLETLTPPGSDIGLSFGGQVELRVRDRVFATNGMGAPRQGVEVSFAVSVDPDRPDDGPAGSTLDSQSQVTDGDGVARVVLTAGHAQTRFLVTATATGALPTTFQVGVSDQGFATLDVRPRYVGGRALTEFSLVRVHLYDDQTCGRLLSGTGPPPSFYPVRSTTRWEEPITYSNLLSKMPYAVLVRGEDAQSRTLAEGCVNLTGTELPPGSEVTVPVAADDRWPLLAGRFGVETTLDLRNLAATVEHVLTPWHVLGDCPAGPGQLLADALTVALPAGPAHAWMDARRGDLTAGGCRTQQATAMASASVDARLSAIMQETPTAAAAQVGGIEPSLATLAQRLELTSLLEVVALGDRAGVAAHTLEHATLRLGTAFATIDLVASARPEVEVEEIALTVSLPPDAPSPGNVALASHAFSLRWGALLRSGAGPLVLAPRGLPATPTALATAMVDQAGTGTSRGCTAIDAAICGDAGLASGCLGNACEAARASLGAQLDGAFSALDGPGADLRLAGAAPIIDADGDLVVESLGTPAAPGAWSAMLTAATGTTTAVPGFFNASKLP